MRLIITISFLVLLIPCLVLSEDFTTPWPPGYFEDECTKAKEVQGYELEYGNKLYTLPSYIKILQNGIEIYSDNSQNRWLTGKMGVVYYSNRNFLLLKTYIKDCIDYYFERLFIISKEGDFIIHQPVWTSHYVGGFFELNGKLAYWSEWFCSEYSEYNKEYRENQSYIYLSNKSWSAFERKYFDNNDYCSIEWRDRFTDTALQFEELKAIK